jgi:hypothetical protein
VESNWDIRITRGPWDTRVVATSTMTADETTFYINCVLEGFEGQRRVLLRSWTFNVPRDHV